MAAVLLFAQMVLPSEVMSSITIKLPEELKKRLQDRARASGKSCSALVRHSIEKELIASSKGKKPSLLDLFGDLAGKGDSGVTDLATNPKYMKGFGE
jgi:plasmid stability protein